MKKQTKIIIAILVVLALAVVACAAIHFATRETVPENAMAVHFGGDVAYVDVASLATESVQGTLVNGKGEEVEIDAKGAALADVLKKAKVDPASVTDVTVTAADEYSATVTGDEVNEAGKVWIILEDDTCRLVVFGDKNMKRSVREAVSIDVQ